MLTFPNFITYDIGKWFAGTLILISSKTCAYHAEEKWEKKKYK